MKKSMIIAIIVVYIISIVAVNFFGLEMKDFEGLIYATDFTVEIIQPDEDGDKIITGNYDEVEDETMYTFTFSGQKGDYEGEDAINPEINPNIIFIRYKLIPDNVDTKSIKIRELSPNENYYFHKETQTVYFINPGIAEFSLETTDGSNIEKTIVIRARRAR